ncbi:MAG: TRAM domain-containing protein, partial [Pirellulales bacterium]
RDRYFADLVDRPLRVLVEGSSPSRAGHLSGTACRYATVEFPGQAGQIGDFVEVTPRQIGEAMLIGESEA